MVAEAEDLRYFYSEALGPCEIVAASGATAKTAAPLTPGRYLVQFNTVAGAALVWAKQGAHEDLEAETAAPSTPFDLGEDPKPRFVVMVRKGAPTDGLAFITNAGTVSVAITRISRGKG